MGPPGLTPHVIVCALLCIITNNIHVGVENSNAEGTCSRNEIVVPTLVSQYIRNYGSIGSCAKLGQADILRKPLVIASSGQMTETDHLPPITYTYPSYSNIPKLTLKDL